MSASQEIRTSAKSGTQHVSVKTMVASCLSIGMFLIALEYDRLADIEHVESATGMPILEILLTPALLAALIVCFYRRASHHDLSPALLAIIAVVCSVSMASVLYMNGTDGPSVPAIIGTMLHSVCCPVLMFLWAQRVVAFGRSFAIRSFGVGLVVLGTLGMLIIVLEQSFAMALLVALPIIGALMLALVDSDEAGRGEANQTESAPAGMRIIGSIGIPRLLVKLLPFFCYAIIFGNVHFFWVTLQDNGVVSLMIQLGASAGSLLCGLAAFYLCKLRWGRSLESIAHLVVMVFALIALWLSTFMSSATVFVCLALLNVAHKLAFLIILLYGFLFMRDKLELSVLAPLAYLSFSFGSCVSALFNGMQIVPTLNVLAAVALAILLFTNIADIVSLYNDNPENDVAPGGEVASMSAAIPAGGAAIVDGIETGIPENLSSQDADTDIRLTGVFDGSIDAASSSESIDYACHVLAGKYDLTRREEEILQLMVRGRSVSRISDTLCISQATTRTHFRNIYAKLGVHSQQDVLDLFERHNSPRG